MIVQKDEELDRVKNRNFHLKRKANRLDNNDNLATTTNPREKQKLMRKRSKSKWPLEIDLLNNSNNNNNRAYKQNKRQKVFFNLSCSDDDKVYLTVF